jgi:hypothetical protein
VSANEKLGKLFDSFDQRRDEQNTAHDAVLANEHTQHAAAVAIFQERIIPPLRLLVEQAIDRGHKAELVEKLAEPYVSVTFIFTPAQMGKGPPFPTPSRLKLTRYGGEIEADTEIGPSSRKSAPPAQRPMGEVNPEWITEKALELVEGSLRE